MEEFVDKRHPKYRQAGIDALDFVPDLWFEHARGEGRPQHHAQSLVGVLIGRHVDVRSTIDVETVALDIPDDTDDGRPRLFTIPSEPHSTAQRIGAWPILSSSAFIDDGHQRLAVFIALGK